MPLLPIEIPNWVIPFLTALGSLIGGTYAGITAYKIQSKRIQIDRKTAEAALKDAGNKEFAAINAGNQALREALLEQAQSAFRDMEHIKQEQEKAQDEAEYYIRRSRRLERLLLDHNIEFPEGHYEQS